MIDKEEVVKKPVIKKKQAPKKPKVDEKVLIKEARALQTVIGYKTKAYLQFVNDHKADMPSEYKLVKGLIERYVCAD